MNMKRKQSPLKQRALLAASVVACTVLGLPVSAATFPNSPLITGGEGIPPNILMILDDSGSMAFVKMPNDVSDGNLDDNPSDRSAINNTIYYNAATNYRPWRTSSTDVNARLAAADIASLSTHTSQLTSFEDLRNSSELYYYVPKTTVTSPGTNASDYEKFRVATSSSSNSVNGSVVQKVSTENYSSVVVASLAKSTYTTCVTVPANGWENVVFETSGGTGDADLYVWKGGNCSGGEDYNSRGNNNNEKITINSPNRDYSYRVYAYSAVTNITITVSRRTWVDATPLYKDKTGTNQQRTQAEELQNVANWYQYFRTRAKTAKAGASEAFGRLGSRYRVGFDTIWNRGNVVTNTSGSSPSYPIPFATDDGLFSGTNRSTFYSRLQGAGAQSGTPLLGALQRAARYYMTDDPWKDSSGRMLSCRQNYSILTTDGFWNDGAGYSNVGNADSGSQYGDSYANTLADVAYKYWNEDLKPGASWPNNVRPSTGDPATHQHMVTFGVSIGLQGRLNPNNPPPATWADPTDREDADRIDDLWHAALNGHGKFVVAGDADAFADALKSALDTISERTASGSNIASSSTKTDAGTLTFAAKFTSGSWIGDLSASPFNAALTGVSTTPLWTLSNTFGASGANGSFASRFVFTAGSTSAVRFDRNYAGASAFERTGGVDAVTGPDNISYILGDQTKELSRVNGTLRARAYPMGDIVDSSPSYSPDTGTVYVGANDGMLHAINAQTGQVLFSYIPRGVSADDLKTLSSTDYAHRYFVDGQIDVITRQKQGSSKNILVAAPGRGAKGVFALDVTNPTTMSTASNFGLLWDRTFDTTNGTADNDMGYVLGNVRLRQSNKKDSSNKPVVFAIVPNGIDSTNGRAILFVYELNSAGGVDATYKLTTDTATGNGMMSTGLADLDGNGTIDTLYGGDLLGRVWKWDISVLDSTHAMPTAGTKIFAATDGTTAQPITGGIGVARDTAGQIFLGFGTGRLLSLSDLPGNTGYVAQTQSMYGIKDNGTLVTRANLQARTIPYTGTVNSLPVRGFEAYSDLPTSAKGWYIDLGIPAATSAGERVITAPTVVGSAMWLTSVIPAQGSDCSGALGSGYLNVLNIFTGTSPLQNSFFDTTATIPGSGSNPAGLIGSMGIVGGMPTEVNVTSQLATVGDGGGGSPVSFKRRPPIGGIPQRMTWREVVAPDN